MKTMEKIIFNNLLHNEEYLRTVLPHLKDEYFYDNVEKRLFKYIDVYFNKYNKIPTIAVLKLSLEKDTKINETDYSIGIELVNSLIDTNENTAWLIDETEKFCKERAIFNALGTALEIKENSEKSPELQNKKIPDLGMMPEVLSNALSVTFDNSVGHDYFDDSEDRWKIYHTKEMKIRFKLNILN